MKDARELAVRVLELVERDGMYASAAFDSQARMSGLDRRKIALAQEMAFGVLRHRRYLEYALPTHRPLKDAHPFVQRHLLVGAYQILFMKSISPQEAVSRAVDLVRKRRGPRAGGMVNAVLRALASMEHIKLPKDPIRRLAIERSLPDWLAEEMIEQFGQEKADALAMALGQVPDIVLRTNLRRISREELMDRLRDAFPKARIEPGRWTPAAIRVRGMPDPVRHHFHREGLYSVQDEGSQLIGLLADPKPGERILDACSGAGGKALHLFDRAGTQIYACDIDPMKIISLRERAHMAGADIRTEVMDLTVQRPDGLFDLVLLDAPCTGLGVLRRNPEARWRLRRDDVDKFARIQTAMLHNLADAVTPGGRLVYAVCTFTRKETTEVIEKFLDSRPDFYAAQPPPVIRSELLDNRFLRLFPHLHETDAFFAAVLRRREA